MKTLERLRLGYFDDFPCYEASHPYIQNKHARDLADAIEAEIKANYVPKNNDDKDAEQ